MPHLPKHKKPKWIAKTKKNRYGYKDKHISVNRPFYNSKAWKELRAWWFKNNPLCNWCNEEGKTVEGNEVDHIKEIIDGGELLDPDNLMTLCSKHHRQKTAWAKAKRNKAKAEMQNNNTNRGAHTNNKSNR